MAVGPTPSFPAEVVAPCRGGCSSGAAVGQWRFAGCACAAAEVVAVVAPLIADDAEEMVGPAACSSYPCFGYPGS